MRSLTLFAALLLLVAGCQPATPPAPPAVSKPVVGPALAKQDDHAGHDHADHDHAGHDHSDHDHAEKDAGAARGEGEVVAEGEAMADDHEGHHHPETLADLVAELDTLAATVRGGLEKGVREEADSAVHEFGHLVEDVEPLAKEAKLPEGVEAAVVKAGSDLFDAFDKLDQAIHGSGDVAEAWKAQAEGIDAALKTLKDAVAK